MALLVLLDSFIHSSVAVLVFLVVVLVSSWSVRDTQMFITEFTSIST
jgi:hypothetical protein